MSSNYYTNCDINELQNEIDMRYQNIFSLQSRIDKISDEIKTIKNIISSKCVHEWERDYSYGMYERSHYKCSTCGESK